MSFDLVDEGGSELLLIYATKAEKGVERMKDAMWRVDPVYGQRSRDPRDEHQLVLDISDEPDLSLLKRQLLERVSDDGALTLSELKRYTLLETIYREPYATTAVRELENEMKLAVSWKRRHEDAIVEPTIFAGEGWAWRGLSSRRRWHHFAFDPIGPGAVITLSLGFTSSLSRERA